MNITKKILQVSELFNQLKEHKDFESIFKLIQKKYVNGFIFSGVGKNWYIAEKIVKTWISLGLKSQALDPIHALHGDIGMIENQIIFLISKSGNTDELCNLVTYINDMKRNEIINPILISISLNKDNALNAMVDYSLYPSINYADIQELDNLNLIPTISISSMQLFLDYLGIILYENNSINPTERYKYNHPAGTIGELLK